jgi:hypothetical protein
MKSLKEILDTPIKHKPEHDYLEHVHESYHGTNMNPITNGDISEAIHTAAGIDDSLRNK